MSQGEGKNTRPLTESRSSTESWKLSHRIFLIASIWKHGHLVAQCLRVENEIKFLKFSSLLWNLLPTFSSDFLRKCFAVSFIQEAWVIQNCPLRSLGYTYHNKFSPLLFKTLPFPKLLSNQCILWFVTPLQKSQILLVPFHCLLSKRHYALWQYTCWLVDRPLKQHRWLLLLYCNY